MVDRVGVLLVVALLPMLGADSRHPGEESVVVVAIFRLVLLLHNNVVLLKFTFFEDDIFQDHRGIRFYEGAAVRQPLGAVREVLASLS